MEKKRKVLLLLLLFFIVTSNKKNVLSEERQFFNFIDVLSSIPRGKLLIQRVLKQQNWKNTTELEKSLRWSNTSKTDTILSRSFHFSTHKELKKKETMIYLNKKQKKPDILLDLVHELAHAASNTIFDPYDISLTPGQYILRSLEGPGGEIEAVTEECRMGAELKLEPSRCYYYNRSITTKKIKEDFYRVGEWYSFIQQELGEEISLFPLLSKESAVFLSSNQNTPYPASLIKDYQEMTETICENSRKRLRYPASLKKEQNESLVRLISKRCH